MSDYEILIKKYMRFVADKDEYGSDNVAGSPYEYAEDYFTRNEWEELQRLSKEAHGE